MYAKEILLFGGRNSIVKNSNNLHIFNTATETLKTVQCSGTPPTPRYAQSAPVSQGSMFIIGGGGKIGVYLNVMY